MLNVGLVGFGFAGRVFHAPVIRAVAGLRLTTIVQRSGGGVPDPHYSDVEFVRSVDELLTRAIDLVVIATPNTSHVASPDREAMSTGRTPRRDR
ncbi:MAG: Gfo/Idh/MocA family oxidoreductase [Gemmatimonadales bacterium]